MAKNDELTDSSKKNYKKISSRQQQRQLKNQSEIRRDDKVWYDK